MIKRTMYFYDKKQADLIKKVNDKLHKKRGLKISDAEMFTSFNKELDDTIKEILDFQKDVASLFGNNMKYIRIIFLGELANTARIYNNKGNPREAKKILMSTLDTLNKFNSKEVPLKIATKAVNLIKKIKSVRV